MLAQEMIEATKEKHLLELNDVIEARERIRDDILHTPLLRIPGLDDALGCQVYLKAECMQITSSFKLRGAMNALRTLSQDERERGVICYSSGNHAQAMAYASKRLGINVKIVMPESVNRAKLALVESHDADIILVDVRKRAETAARLARDEQRTLVHPFATLSVKAGQGTCGLEIVQDLPHVDAVVVPIGGGGLVSGVATAVKAVRPEVRVYGVENMVVPRYTRSLNAGYCHDLTEVGETIADATRGVDTDESNYEIISSKVDDVVTVNDEQIVEALRLVLERGHILAEPSSCMAPAAALSNSLPLRDKEHVVFVLSGGNYDLNAIMQLLIGTSSDFS